MFWDGRFLRFVGVCPQTSGKLGRRPHLTPKMPAASCCQASTVNAEWLRAIPDLEHQLAKRFYLADWIDGYSTQKDAYNQIRPATLLAELRYPLRARGRPCAFRSASAFGLEQHP